MLRNTLRIAALALAACALWQGGAAAYIHAKAALAQVLIRTAWDRTRQGEQAVKPWPWADTWPVARLVVPAHGVDLYVLEGTTGRSLAFGPGRLSGSAAPGRPGVTLISAHRDTHFAFLEEIRAGDEVLVESADGVRHRYRVVDTEVMHQAHLGLALGGADDGLTLVTCYPFRAIDARGPLRYVVSAVLVPGG
jgi:sortase A